MPVCELAKAFFYVRGRDSVLHDFRKCCEPLPQFLCKFVLLCLRGHGFFGGGALGATAPETPSCLLNSALARSSWMKPTLFIRWATLLRASWEMCELSGS